MSKPPKPCIVHRCPEYAVEGQSHCSKHLSSRTPSSRVAQTWEHRKLRRAMIEQAPKPFVCPRCRRTIRDESKIELHHEQPVATGGADGPVRLLCQSCNGSLGDRVGGKPHPRLTGRRQRGRRRAPRSKSPWMTGSTDLPPAA
jgi:hypothetical protein